MTAFADVRQLEHRIIIGRSALLFSLHISANHDLLFVEYIEHAIRVFIPSILFEQWISSGEIGFECLFISEGSEEMNILIEKDIERIKNKSA